MIVGFVKWIFLGIILFCVSGGLFRSFEIAAALLTDKIKGRGKWVAR